MQVKILNLNSGNPFQHFPEDLNYKKQETFDKIMKNLLPQVELSNKVSCLEIGAGSNLLTAKGLVNLGAKVVTLDINWTPERDTLSYEEYVELQRDVLKALVPTFYGKDEKIKSYLGDLAFLDHKESQLKDNKFDLIYFYDSMFTNGLNQTVSASSTARYLDLVIPFSERILKANAAINNGGVLFATGMHENFTERYDKQYGTDIPKCVGWTNNRLTDLLLYWAIAGATITGKKPTLIGMMGQTKESLGGRFSKYSQEQIQNQVYRDTIDFIIGNNFPSLFGNENNYRNLREASEILPREERAKLAVIDAVFVKY